MRDRQTNLQTYREHCAFSIEQMAQLIGVPVSAYALAEAGFPVGRRHHERFVEFFQSEWLADAARRRADPIVLGALGIFTLPDMAIPEQFR